MNNFSKRAFWVNILGIIIARTVFFGMNPAAVGFFAAAYTKRESRKYIFFSVILGVISVMNPVEGVKYAMICLVTIVVISLLEKKGNSVTAGMAGAIAGAASCIVMSGRGFLEINTKYYLLLAVMEAVLIWVSAGIFEKGLDFILHSKKGSKIGNEELISISILGALFMYSLPDMNLSIPITEIGIFFLVLLFGYKYGTGAGAAAGSICGIILGLRGMHQWNAAAADYLFGSVGMMSMLGIMSGTVREIGKFGTLFIYGFSGFFLSFAYNNGRFDVNTISAVTSAVMIFLLVPKKFLLPASENVSKNFNNIFAKDRLQNRTQVKLQEFSESFKKLSHTFRTIADQKNNLSFGNKNMIFDGLSENVCRSCSNCKLCWQEEFSDTYQSACTIFDSVEANGTVLVQDVPVSFANRCTNLDSFLTETVREMTAAKVNLGWQNRMAESREAIAGQLLEVSNMIYNFSEELESVKSPEDGNENELAKKLYGHMIEVKDLAVLEKKNGKEELYFTGRTKRGHCMTMKEASGIISEDFGKRMRAAEGCKNIISKEWDTFCFEEDTNFSVLTGVARTAKDNEKVSGDNFSFIELDSGNAAAILSDGMGSGVKASTESESVVELLEQFLGAGFQEETAIKLINSMLVLKSEKQSFSTIDMSVLDLFTGNCQFVKIGASTTFIKRENWVETISSTTIPVGIFNEVDYDNITKKLYSGDFIIMVSDGILDSIRQENKEAFLEEYIMQINSHNPQEIANIVLRKAMEECRFIPADDMTVLVMGIWEK